MIPELSQAQLEAGSTLIEVHKEILGLESGVLSSASSPKAFSPVDKIIFQKEGSNPKTPKNN